MNRDIIKYIAMATMFCNHFAQIFLEPGTLAFEILTDIGYFTSITMCYFLVEGFRYTRSKRKYGQRLFVFGIISQVPFTLACGFFQLNMIFTLFICFLILYAQENMHHLVERRVFIAVLIIISVFCDWALLAPLFTLLFSWSRNNKKKIALGYAVSALLFGCLNFSAFLLEGPWQTALLRSIISVAGIFVSGIVILRFYNGKKGTRGGAFSKWFFYVFYPVHLMLLWGIKVLL